MLDLLSALCEGGPPNPQVGVSGSEFRGLEGLGLELRGLEFRGLGGLGSVFRVWGLGSGV